MMKRSTDNPGIVQKIKEYLHLFRWDEWIAIVLALPIMIIYQIFTKIESLFEKPEEIKKEKIIYEVSKKNSTYLYPKKAKPLPLDKSKFGGPANSGAISKWPNCKVCNKSLVFILQLFKEDFSELYFPKGKDLFQLFGCFNDECSGHFENQHLNALSYCYYGNKATTELKGKSGNSCSLSPKKIHEFPHELSDIYALNKFENSDKKKKLRKKGEREPLTKIPGYPDWIHAELTSRCECGNQKEVFFQLSSEEYKQHGIMLGDVGVLYLYICKKCGEKSIESMSNCY